MKKAIFLIIGTFLIGLLLGTFLSFYQTSRQITGTFKIKSIRAGQNGLINPILEYEIGKNIFSNELKNFQDSIGIKVNQELNNTHVQKIAVYFRDLNNGPWFGVNENDNFFPASLIKIPVLIAALHKSETDPTFLSKKLTYTEDLGDFNKLQEFQPQNPILQNQSYTVEQLLKAMIVDSDNNAYNILQLELGPDQILKVFTDFGLPAPDYQKEEEINSPHDYATFLRILYNASYLNKEDSIKALQLMTNTNFTQGLVAGVPGNIKVAHKFGSFAHGDKKELHDCGIIYYPGKPYLLCIMTQGDNFDTLKTVLKDTSQSVYQEINQQIIPTIPNP